MRTFVGGFVTVGLILFYLLSASVPRSYAGPLCEARSAAHAAEHGTTVAADSRYHVARGELPTCEAQPQQRQENRSSSSSNSSKSYEDEGKSRHCRKHWYC